MDTEKQLYESDATGWQRGLYDDIQHTFRAPIVNWIFRTTMANYPDFLRYAWGQLKPLYTTQAFARFSTQYRDTILSAVEDSTTTLPTYRCADLGLRPPEYRELVGQIATFDVVAPRLALLFCVTDRALHDERIGHEFDAPGDRAATAPFPVDLDRDRGTSPTMISGEDVPDELDNVVDSIRDFHGLDDSLPSIYRCLCQWPPYLSRAWNDLEPALTGTGFDDACGKARAATEEFVESAPYRPRLDPDSLRSVGFDESAITDLGDLFREFNRGPIETVIPALPVYAATVDAEGQRVPL